MQRRRAPLRLLTLLVAFGAGGLCNASVGTAWASSYRGLDVFARVLAHVENSYVDEIPSERLIYGAIKGMLEVLDPYSVFLEPVELSSIRDDAAGEFGGLGIELSEEADGQAILVVAPLEGTPASRAGILAGDRILAIDGESTAGMSVFRAVERSRGKPGTEVTLRLMREGFTAPRDFTLKRDVVRLVSVESTLYPDGYGYVRIKHFQEQTDDALGKALQRLREENGGKLSGLILDLRNNPGGLLDQAVRVSDRFLREGTIVSTEGRGGRPLELQRAHEKGTEPDYPLIVLVNGGSASASEIVAGALQDHGRALVMGTPTFGKGSVQTVIDLNDGSGLKLTIARYFTPKHRSIQGVGILPDVIVEERVEPRPTPPKDALPEKAPGKKAPRAEADHIKTNRVGSDAQLLAALAQLQHQPILGEGPGAAPAKVQSEPPGDRASN